MTVLKRQFIFIGVIGFILAYGTAGTSDFEAETGQILMTDAQLYLRIAISLIMFVCCALGAAALQSKQ